MPGTPEGRLLLSGLAPHVFADDEHPAMKGFQPPPLQPYPSPRASEDSTQLMSIIRIHSDDQDPMMMDEGMHRRPRVGRSGPWVDGATDSCGTGRSRMGGRKGRSGGRALMSGPRRLSEGR